MADNIVLSIFGHQLALSSLLDLLSLKESAVKVFSKAAKLKCNAQRESSRDRSSVVINRVIPKFFNKYLSRFVISVLEAVVKR